MTHVLDHPQPIQYALGMDDPQEALAQALASTKKRRRTNPETKLTRQIIDWLHAKGCLAIRVNSGFFKFPDGRAFRGNNQAGCADVIACVPYHNMRCGLFVSIEVKTAKNKPSPKQESFAERVRRSGGIAILARSIADLERELPWL